MLKLGDGFYKEMPLATHTLFAKKKFTNSDLKTFAVISGDKNPLHLDPLAARRSPEGSRVVHGILLMLYGLDRLAHLQKNRSFQRIKCVFKKPILMDEKAEYLLTEQNEITTKLSIRVENIPCAEMELTGGLTDASNQHPPYKFDEKLDDLKEPLDLVEDKVLPASAAIRNPKHPRIKTLFPELCRVIKAPKISALSRLSYIVGMIYPGLYSLFSSLDVTLGDQNTMTGFTSFAVSNFDDRFKLVGMTLGGDLTGSIKAFCRPRPYQQPSMGSIQGIVRKDEFINTQALIIGGSRGLGELTSKLICAGGGSVFLSYNKGKVDSGNIADEIKKSGSGYCRTIHLDIQAPLSPSFLVILNQVDSVYYFPTPAIFKKQPKIFPRRQFDEFIDFYVGRFFDICEAIEKHSEKKVQVFFPSTSAIDQRPNGMTAYTMAKMAGEILIQDMNKHFKKVNILSCRLPRLGSDQTNSILEGERKDNLTVLLPIIRDMRDPSRKKIES